MNICTMVFGNMGTDSATGVGFTRDPGTGDNSLYGDYLVNAQGEDVVAGIRTPRPLRELRTDMPEIYKQLEQLRHTLEQHYHEVQDFEFTIERGKLYMLQTRNGKMNAWALCKTSVELVKEGLINEEEALLRIPPDFLEQFLHRRIDPDAKVEPIAVGIAASPGAAVGKVVFDTDRAERFGNGRNHSDPHRNQAGRYSWLLCGPGHPHQPGRQDLPRTTVVARGMGKPCVSGRKAWISTTNSRGPFRSTYSQGRRYRHHRRRRRRGVSRCGTHGGPQGQR